MEIPTQDTAKQKKIILLPVFLTFLIALFTRISFIQYWPDAFLFDAYQRWAGREHLYIQVWLPMTQMIIWIIAKLGGSMLITRYVFALLGSVVLALGAALVQKLSLPRAGWFFIPLAIFGPFLVWSTVPYQESTFLFFLFSALLVGDRYPKLGDLLMGGLALVRYEGWPLIIIHCLLRRKWIAVISLWGIILWLGIRYFELLIPYQASPDSFSDWNDLSANLTWKKAKYLSWRFWLVTQSAATPYLFVLGGCFFFLREPKNTKHYLLLLALLGQLLATIGWLFSLGIAFSRMLIIPSVIAGLFMAISVALLWEKVNHGLRILAILSMLIFSLWTLRDGFLDFQAFHLRSLPDIELIAEMKKCPNDSWSIIPRPHKGPRKRHDACEVIQGLTNLRAGKDFNCLSWDWGGPEPTIHTYWNPKKEIYITERVQGEQTGECSY